MKYSSDPNTNYLMELITKSVDELAESALFFGRLAELKSDLEDIAYANVMGNCDHALNRKETQFVLRMTADKVKASIGHWGCAQSIERGNEHVHTD